VSNTDLSALTNTPYDIETHLGHISSRSLFISSTLKGFTPNGRYIHVIKNGRATYHPGYYTIDGRLLEPHT